MSQAASSGRINPEICAREIGRFDREVDVLVVGFGCAGACTALEAAAAGAETLVLERASGGGGTSAMSGGVIYMGGGTDIQKQCGFDDSPEEMFKYLMAASGNRPDESKISVFCEGSIEHFHWIVDNGVPFSPVFYPDYSGEPPNDDGLVYSGSENVHPFNEIARPAPRGHVPKIPGAAGGLLMQKLVSAVDASPAQVLTDTICDALVRNDDGSIAGAIATAGRESVAIRARRGVVLTTGGFINDDDMVGLHSPLLHRCSLRVGADGDDGSGIRMGMAVGASTLNLGMGSISLPIHPPKSASIGVLVNRYGQRFINEDAYMGRLGEHVLFHQDGIAYLIFDDAHFVRLEIERDVVATGETVAALEGELELPDRSRPATKERYNPHPPNSSTLPVSQNSIILS